MKVSIKQYSQTLFDLTDGKSEQEVFDVVKKFAEQMKADGQLKNAGQVMEKFSEIHNAKNGVVVAEITTREKVGQETIDKIEKFIKEKYFAKEVEMKILIDEKIKGGVIIKVGDEVIDGSIENQLKRLKKSLIN
jgi:F-type H+-transporting ATPase subunit delta